MRSLAGAVAGACLIALTSCSFGSEDEPATAASTASQPPSEPATQEGQPTRGSSADRLPEPVLPVQAQGTSVRSAEAFVEYYIDLLNYAMVTGDTKAFRAASRSCQGCERYADLFDATYARGGSARTNGWRVTESFGAPLSEYIRVIADIRASALVIEPAGASRPERYAADRYELTLDLRQGPAGWHVVNFSGA